MGKHRLEVADVFRNRGSDFLASFGERISADQRRVLKDICLCRTAALGGHKTKCDHCGHEEISYNSCRNRHCPKCQGTARARWLEDRKKELLDIDYFHVVFTLPEEIGPIALQNKLIVYGTLFRAVSETLLRIAKDPKHLGAEIGFLAVLHSWGQNLHYHPHVHCIASGGGLSPDQSRWIPCKEGFFLPVRVLSRFFRRCFLDSMNEAYRKEKLYLKGNLQRLQDPSEWNRFLKPLKEKEWVVFSKPPFGGPIQVLKYLARYTHRVAISNRRLVSIEGDEVSFRIRDYAKGNRIKTITLEAVEFIRRFLSHVLPKGFMHIRSYGLLANRVKEQKLESCRRCLRESKGSELDNIPLSVEEDYRLCPSCRKGQMIPVVALQPDDQYLMRILALMSLWPDTS